MSALSIPEPRADDDEDVHWALSTAAALCTRGEVQEALKWLRRAAENASDANRDMRALELFKAAADFTAKLQQTKNDKPPDAATPPPLPQSPSNAPPPVHPHSATMLSQRGPSGRSSPPPPPRGRQHPGGGTLPLDPNAMATVIPQGAPPKLDTAMEAMAPTVPGPALPQPIAVKTVVAPDPAAPHPFAATHVSGQQRPRNDMKSAKTLASNLSYEALGEAAAQLAREKAAAQAKEAAPIATKTDPLRAAIAKATTISDAHARELANRAAKHMGGGDLGRATHAGIGPDTRIQETTSPEARSVQPSMARARPGVPDPAQNQRPTVVARSPQASTVPAPPGAQARVQSERPPPSRGRRRTTHSGRRISSPARDEVAPKTTADPRPGRFDDELTIERDLTSVGANLSSGFDLEENTNVLSGQEAFVEVVGEPNPTAAEVGISAEPSGSLPGGVPDARPTIPDRDIRSENRRSPFKRDSAAPESGGMRMRMSNPTVEMRPTEELLVESTDPGPGPVDLSSTDAMPASRHNADLSGLSAYRVALGRDPARGTLDVVPLAAGEPAPAGRIAVVLLAVDIGSSLSLAELFSKVRAADGRTQHKTRK